MEFVSGVTLQEFITTFSDKVRVSVPRCCARALANRGTGARAQKLTVPADIAWSIFVQLCSALRYLHIDKQIVHRDLKPANVMVDAQYTVKLGACGACALARSLSSNPRGRARVADFGLASEQHHGEMNSVVGTISYCWCAARDARCAPVRAFG